MLLRLFLLAFLVVTLSGCGERTYDADNDVHGAWSYTQLFVKERLSAPSTAKFPFGGFRDVEPLGNGRYRVRSYVDSQNAFGGIVRTKFTAVINRIDGGWRLENLTIE